MIPEGLDRTISTVLAIFGAIVGLWAHKWDMSNERSRASKEKLQAEVNARKKYADRELKEYAAQRDFGHIQRDLEQLKINTTHLNEEADQRLDLLERQFERFSGALEVLTDLLKERGHKD